MFSCCTILVTGVSMKITLLCSLTARSLIDTYCTNNVEVRFAWSSGRRQRQQVLPKCSFLPACLPTYLPTYFHTYLSTHLSMYLHTSLPLIYPHICPPIYEACPESKDTMALNLYNILIYKGDTVNELPVHNFIFWCSHRHYPNIY